MLHTLELLQDFKHGSHAEAPKSIIHMPKVSYKTHTVCVCVQRVISVEGEIILSSIPIHISHSAVSCSSSSSRSRRAKSSPGPCDFYSVVILLCVLQRITPAFILSLPPSLLLLLLSTKVSPIPLPLFLFLSGVSFSLLPSWNSLRGTLTHNTQQHGTLLHTRIHTLVNTGWSYITRPAKTRKWKWQQAGPHSLAGLSHAWLKVSHWLTAADFSFNGLGWVLKKAFG